MNRIRAGFCHWINPFSGRIFRVSLTPEDCIALVFWKRNPGPLMAHLPELDRRGYKYCFLYTIIGYPRPLETHAPDGDTAIRTFQALSERLSPDFVIWRYDPIIISSRTPVQYHLDRFTTFAGRLAGYTHQCIYSFLSVYGKTAKNLSQLTAQHGITFTPPSREDRHDLLTELVRISNGHAMQLSACCTDDYRHVSGIQQSHCVDLVRLQKLTGNPHLHLKSRPTRKLCGCVASVDIGSYDTCLFGCAYCYATHSRHVGLKNHAAHDPDDTILYRPAGLRGVDLDTLVYGEPKTESTTP